MNNKVSYNISSSKVRNISASSVESARKFTEAPVRYEMGAVQAVAYAHV